MKIRKIITVFLLPIILASCVPPSTPSPTAIITPTSTATSTPSPTKTSTPDPRISISFNSETFFVTDRLQYSENANTLNIDPLKVRVIQSPSIESHIGEILWYMDETTGARFIWNSNLLAWVPEFKTSMDYKNPEASPVVPLEAYYDGSNVGDPEYAPSSVALSDALYAAEHPELIASDATYPYYRATLAWSNETVIGYEIALTGPNQYLITDENKTDVARVLNRPFAYFGVQQTKNKDGSIIYIIKKANWNPTQLNEDEILTFNMGFDKSRYEEWFKYQLILDKVTDPHTTGELSPVFPYEFGVYHFNKDSFYVERQGHNPSVASLLDTSMINMFEPEIRQRIIDLYNGVGRQFDPNTNRMSILIGSLPLDLSNMILYTSVHQFYI